MRPDGADDLANAAGNLMKGAGTFINSLASLRPGMRRASEGRGIATANEEMLDELERTRTRCEKMRLPQETADALCMRVIREYGKAENLGKSLSFAQSIVGTDYDATEIDHSWFMKWEDGASEQCDEEMQQIWGQLLAGKLEQPGSYSKHALSILSDMSSADARAFRKLCGTCLNEPSMDGVNNNLIYLHPQVPGYELTSDEILRLDTLGLSHMNPMAPILSTNGVPIDSSGTVVSCNSKSFLLQANGSVVLNFISTPLTFSGKELSALCAPGSSEGFEQSFLVHMRGLGVSVRLVVEWNPNGSSACYKNPIN